MRWIKNLIDSYTSKFFNSLEINIVNKIILIYFISVISFIAFIVFGIIAVLNTYYIFSILLFSILIIIILNFFYLKRTWKHNLCGYILIYSVSAVFLILLLTGGTYGTGYLWLYCYPVLVISILGSKKGGYFSIGFFLASLAIMITHKYLLVNIEYDITFAVRFLSTYIIIFLIVYFYEFQRNYNYNRLVRSILNIKEEINKKDDFISKLSHQIRTPLNNITIISNLVDRNKLDSKQRDLFDTIIASSNNLVNIVNNIAKVSNIKLVDEVVTKVKFNLYETVNNTLILFRDQYGSKLNLNFTFSKRIKNILIGDPIRIKQLFMNIIETVIKVHSEKRIIIDIEIDIRKETEKKVELLFNIKLPLLSLLKDDYGNYYVQSDKKQIDTETNEIIDKYLDFIIARRIIAAQNGELEVNNDKKQTIISFLLKFNKDIEKAELLKKEEVNIDAKDLLKTHKKVDLKDSNVLLVEDNAVNQKIILLSLKNNVRNIDVANNGKEALDKFGKSKYNLILMDIQMPIMNGIIATKKIRELELSTNTQTPIIAITANALSGDREACIASGMNDYISKPFQAEVLIQKMRILLEKDF